MFKHLVFALGLLSAANVTAQSHWPNQGPRFQSVRWDFECASNFKVRSVRMVVESSEKGTRYALKLKSFLVNEKPVAEKDMIVMQGVVSGFNALPQAFVMCSEDNASLYVGPEYRKIGYRNGKFIRAPHVVDILSIRPDGVSLSGQMEIAK